MARSTRLDAHASSMGQTVLTEFVGGGAVGGIGDIGDIGDIGACFAPFPVHPRGSLDVQLFMV